MVGIGLGLGFNLTNWRKKKKKGSMHYLLDGIISFWKVEGWAAKGQTWANICGKILWSSTKLQSNCSQAYSEKKNKCSQAWLISILFWLINKSHSQVLKHSICEIFFFITYNIYSLQMCEVHMLGEWCYIYAGFIRKLLVWSQNYINPKPFKVSWFLYGLADMMV